MKSIKETFGKFRACLKRDPRDKWIALIDNLPILTHDNYQVDNTFGVQAFYENQTNMVSKSLNEDAVEMAIEYL